MQGFRQMFYAVVMAMLSIMHVPGLLAMAKQAFSAVAKIVPSGSALAGAIKAHALALARQMDESKLQHMWRTCKNACAKLAMSFKVGGGSADQRGKSPGAFSGMLPTAFIARSEGTGLAGPSAASC